jgi:hypothetical protein
MMKTAAAISALLLLASVLPAQKKGDEDPTAPPKVPFFGKEQKESKANTRPIRGVVKDPKESPVAGAVVTLVNKQTKEGQSVTTDSDGTFFFGECKKNVDYEVKAEFKKSKTPAKLVSVYNPAARPFVELKLEEAAAKK